MKEIDLDKVIEKLDSYSDDEIISLYNNRELYTITEVFMRIKGMEGCNKIPFLDVDNTKPEFSNSREENVRASNMFLINRIKLMLKSNQGYNINDRRYMEDSILTVSICNEIIFLYAGGFDKLKRNFPEYKDIENPAEISEYHRQCNDIYTKLPWEIKKNIYKFIFEVLQFLPWYMLDELLKMVNKKKLEKYEKINKTDKIIYKYDKNMVLAGMYKSRNECCEKNNIDKSSLSRHLSGKRKTLNGFIYKEDESK